MERRRDARLVAYYDFEEGQGTVLTGTLVDGRFQATIILAKHDETYQPKEVSETLAKEGACQHPESG